MGLSTQCGSPTHGPTNRNPGDTMGKRISREMRESKDKIQGVAQRQTTRRSPTGPQLRNSAAGQRLAELRKKKAERS